MIFWKFLGTAAALSPISQAKAIPASDYSTRCGSLQGCTIPGYNFVVTNASYVESYSLKITSTGELNENPFCRLYAELPYGNNNTVNFEVWLPNAYNGRFLAVGNSGMAGTVDTFNMMSNLNSGFAVAGGDSGHLASLNHDGSGAPDTYLPYLHNKDQVLAWIHNSVAMFTPPARKLVQKYYGSSPGYSYYWGCSTGGAQGFALAQLHPELFDGIYAGCPGFWYSHLALSFLWNAQHTQGSSYLDQNALDLITSAVLNKCDALDGVEDGVLEDPTQCSFDIDTLACPGTVVNSTACLTPAQLEAAKAIYTGPKDVRTTASIYPGFAYGSEVEWAEGQEGTLADAFSVPLLQNLVFDNLSYVADSFDWGGNIDTVDKNAGILIDETDLDLTKFHKKGGKMLVTQGWADPYNAPTVPVHYLQGLQRTFGGDVSGFFNLFMVPGGGHCGSASHYPSVPAKHHVIDALIGWAERGAQPKYVISTTPEDASNRSRILCAWPETARYIGGDVDSWTSYLCA